MDKKLIDRINYLARKKKSVGLTEEELKEQEELRNEYRRQFRANLMNQVANIRVIKSIEENSINEIKAISIDQISLNDNYVCNLELVTILYTLVNKTFNLNNDKLFVLDNSATNILYTLLHLCGYKVNMNDIKDFSKYNYDNEFTLLDVMNVAKKDLDSYTYLLLDDKTLITSQLESLDKNLKNLIVLSNVDSLHEGEVVSLLEDKNVDYIIVNNTYEEINETISKIKENHEFKFILIRTKNELISKDMLTQEYIEELKKNLNVSKIPFSISDVTYDDFKKNVISRNDSNYYSKEEEFDSINKILNKISK